jgi:hypothetical protein
LIAQTVVDEIRKLLSRPGLSQRKIARWMGVSRGTVGRIASGKRPDYRPDIEDEEHPVPAGPPRRCPQCGGLVYMPCRLCRTRALAARSTKRAYRGLAEPEGQMSVELEGEYRARYEEVRFRGE